jgi:hypothetical protein
MAIAAQNGRFYRCGGESGVKIVALLMSGHWVADVLGKDSWLRDGLADWAVRDRTGWVSRRAVARIDRPEPIEQRSPLL